MSSSNWRPPTVEDGWESCASDTTDPTNTPIMPPPKYSSFQIIDSVGVGSSCALQLGQGQRENGLENGHAQSATHGPTWHKKVFSRIPVKKISSYITLGNIAIFIGISFVGFLFLCLAIVIAVLCWNMVVVVIANRARFPSKDD
ncbi:hypothetical protein V495_07683 [Pseudogymnoascus sp. VKM F-4514 (FW-929)]|nr:hypothetical protein V495_07683 [Pseudogymnoascus sp. VKM F-4514 (FW-929)]KFY51727.1 hypothetical protein V497_08894 [Pseudogymnoascus sp. VKM F-4516 (FW-969)]